MNVVPALQKKLTFTGIRKRVFVTSLPCNANSRSYVMLNEGQIFLIVSFMSFLIALYTAAQVFFDTGLP